jgi:CRISPR-associated protein (TIGR02584 family)
MNANKTKSSRTAPSGRRSTRASSTSVAPFPNRKSEIENQKSEVVLLAVTGLSPAVLTETVWALAEEKPAVIPSRVIVVTTAQGRDSLGRLFAPSPRLGGVSPWDALRRALEARGHSLKGRLRFGQTADDIRVITAHDHATDRSVELPDLRDRADNEATADFFLEQVRSLVENPDTDLVVSLAGGRKTMGVLLYACLTLVGRETDRLTHVLVNEPFETMSDFWFPGQPEGKAAGQRLKDEGQRVKAEGAGSKSQADWDPAMARVDLADVPFVPLRNLFARELGRKAGTFNRLVESCRSGVRRRAAEGLNVSLDPKRAELEVNGTRFKLAPAELLLLLFLARRARNHEPVYAAYKDAVDDLNAFRLEQLAARNDSFDWRHALSLKAPWDEREIVRTVSDLRQKLRARGGDAVLLAACLPERGRCSLDVPGSLIFIK